LAWWGTRRTPFLSTERGKREVTRFKRRKGGKEGKSFAYAKQSLNGLTDHRRGEGVVHALITIGGKGRRRGGGRLTRQGGLALAASGESKAFL